MYTSVIIAIATLMTLILLLLEIIKIRKLLEKNNRNIDFEKNKMSDEELYKEAKKIVIETGKISASHLQRKLSISYSLAAKLIDELECADVVESGHVIK